MALETEHGVKPLSAVIRPTTFVQSPRLNERTKLDITIAAETFQVTGSFKFRAAYNLASHVSQSRIITASSGNFGQALAYACKLLGKEAIVVMPHNSAQTKVEAVREYGGIVELVNTATKSRAARVAELGAQFPDAYVASAYDDDLVIEGNASLGREIAGAPFNFDCVLTPVGGGGLAAGIIVGMRDSGKKHVPIFGVEPAMANDASRSMKLGRIVENESEPQTIADGVRTVSLGSHNWHHIQTGLTDILEVSEDSISEAVGVLFALANLKVEPTGAITVAALLSAPERFAGKKICCVASGGNVDNKVILNILQQ